MIGTRRRTAPRGRPVGANAVPRASAAAPVPEDRRSAIARIARATLRTTAIVAAANTAALLPGALAGCGPGSRRGGRLVVYAAGPRRLAERFIAAFTAEHGIEVDLFTATTGQVLAKVEAERLNPRADVLVLASGLAAEWMRREGRLASLEIETPQWASDPRRTDWIDPHGTFVATGAACVGIAVREGWTRGTQSWASMFDGAFVDAHGVPGRVVMPSPSRSGTSGDFVVQWTLAEGERAWSLLTDARRRGIFEVKGANSEALSSLRMNESQAIVAAVDYLVCDGIAAGQPLRLSFPHEGAPIVTRPVCILRSSRRLDAARKFAQFTLSPQAQRFVAEANMLPADPSVALSPVRSTAGVPAPMPIDLDLALADQRAILRRFQYEVERMVVVS